MWPTRSLVRAALSASLLSTMMPMLAAVAMLEECPVAIAGGNVLQDLCIRGAEQKRTFVTAITLPTEHLVANSAMKN